MNVRSIAARCFASAFVLTAALSAAGPAFAQSAAQWPDRPVRILVPVGAGGIADTLSRTLGSQFSQFANGQPLIVENRTGAGGTLAAAAVAREAADGYTLFLTDIGPNAVAHALMATMPYDPHTAFTPIIHVANIVAAILIRPEQPYKTLAEFIAAAKQQPGKFNYASAGIGNWSHLFMLYLNSLAGIDTVNVSYRSGPEILTAIIKGEATAGMTSVASSLSLVREGKLRALAVGSLQRVPQLPDVPPAAETVPGLEFGIWHGIAAPAGMDPALANRINNVFNQVLQVPSVRTTITQSWASNIIGGTPQQFDSFIKSELKRWPDVVKAAGIKPQ